MDHFNVSRIPEIIAETLNPEFFFLNLNPFTSSKDNTKDLTSFIFSWLLVIIIVIILIILKRRVF